MYRKMVTRLLVMMLSIATLACGGAILMGGEVYAAGESSTTRAGWLSQLVETFSMTVEEDNMPEDYYPDVSSERSDYEDIMKAVEFGVIDLAPGSELRPDDPLTREFAADTLTFCLGYEDDGETEYTFSDTDAVENDYAAQIAVERGWFALVDGAFNPAQEVTETEISAMVADAQELISQTEIDTSYENQFEFADGVVEIPNGTEYTINEDETVVTITGIEYADQLTSGTLFAVYKSDFPLGYKVVSTTVENGNTVVTVELADDQEILTLANAEGVIEGDLADFVPAEGVEIVAVEEESSQVDPESLNRYAPKSLKGSHRIKNIVVSKTLSVGQGITFTPKFTISNITLKYKTRWLSYAYAGVEADISVSSSLYVNTLDALGYSGTIDLGTIPVGGVGYVKLEGVLSLDGTFSATATYHLDAGVTKEIGSPVRATRVFSEREYHLHLVVDGKAGVRAKAGFGIPRLLDGNVHAEAGVKAKLDAEKYGDGLRPEVCATAKGWIYATYGYSMSAFEGQWDLGSQEYTIYNYNNSPKKVAFHWEDGTLVSRCARHPDDPFWFTRWNSRYGSTSGGWGLNDEGELVPVFTFKLKNGEAYITGYTGYAYTLDIPETVSDDSGEYTVVGIAEDAFENRTDIHYIMFPDTITTIECAFAGCTSLCELDLPDNLESLAAHAFSGDTALASVDVPKSLSYCGYSMFGAGPFINCSALKTVNFEQGITTIPMNIFYGCTGLEEITIPDTVTKIELRAFKEATNLSKAVISDSVTEIEHNAFTGCTSLSDVYLSKGLTTLEYDAFNGDTALISIEIPKSLDTCSAANTTNSGGPFACCSALKNVTFEAGATQIPMDLFYGCTGIEEITIPDTVTKIEDNAFNSATNLSKVVIPDSVTEIEHNAFAGCTSLSDVDLPKRLTYLGYDAFNGDTALTSIEIPKSLDTCSAANTTDSGGPFAGCSALKNVKFEENVNQIARYLFDSCTGIEEMTIPDTVTVIEEGAFREATNLKTITVPAGVTVIDKYAFQDCTALSEVNLKEGLTTINLSAFNGDTALASITIPSSVTSIGSSAFANSGLTEITIPEGVEELGGSIFANCSELAKVVVSDTVTSLGTSAFSECDKLTEVDLGEGLTTIPKTAFSGCDVIEKVVLPHGITTVGANAFKECVALKGVTMFRNVTSIDSTAFSYPEKVTIYGIAGTYPETFASENSITFVAIENPATAVTLDQSSLTLNNGASVKLKLTVTPADYTDEVSWKSNDESVVTVEDGTVTAKGVGTATVRATVGSVKATCSITVVQPVTSITLNKTSLSLEGGDTYQLTATPKPDSAEDKTVTWSSSDETVATVSESGLVTAVAKGTAEITVTSAAVPTVSKTCEVTVTNTKVIAKTVDELESPHPYENSCTDSWSYTDSGAASLKVTFSDDTCIDDFGDYLDVYNSDGTLQGEYTGTALAGQTIETTGDTVVIKFNTDESDNAWGFKVANVERVEAPCEHEWSDWTVTKEASCTEDGSKTRTCSRCGETETVVIEATGHTIVVIEGKAATCTESGLSDGEKCSVCGEILTAQEVIPALGHDYKAVVTEPTCTEAGYTTYTCSRCSDEYVADETPALGHDWSDWEEVTAATEETTGLERRTCSRCGEVEEREIPVLDHQHTLKHVEAVEATCTEAGNSEYWTCTKCGHYFSDAQGTVEINIEDTVIQALGHDYEDVVTEPTCTETGYTTHTCSRCGHEYTDNQTAALGHSWSDWTVTKEASCTEDGSKTRTCSRCGETETEVIKATGHTIVVIEGKAATCTESGLSDGEKCSVCGEILTAQEVIPALGHDWSDWEEVTAATEDAEGLERRTCSRCGEVEERVIPMLDHQHVLEPVEATAPTCTEAGNSKYWICTSCGRYFRDEQGAEEINLEDTVIQALGHDYKSVVTEPTCTEAGYTTHTCTHCGHEYTDNQTPALGHAWNESPTIDKAATCTEDGVESIHCSRCDAIKEGSETVIPKTGHTFSAWKITKAATEIATGQRTRTCSTCGYVQKQTIAMLKPTLPVVKIAAPKAAKKAATIKWKKVSKNNQKKIAKIQIQYSLDKNFKTGVKTVYAKKSAASKKITKLKSKKTYYVRIRAYKKSGGKVHVSKWSSVKKVKAK